MRIYTQEEMDALIRCPKRIVEAVLPSPTVREGYLRNRVYLISEDGHRTFSIFMRFHLELRHKFSVGMEYLPEDDERFCLIRCDGHQTPHTNRLTGERLVRVFHVHRATEEAIRRGYRPDDHATPTLEYHSYDGALLFLFRETNVVNARQLFPDEA